MPARFATTLSRALLAAAAMLAFAAEAQVLSSSGVRAVPTYEAVGLYWSAPGASSVGCDVRYRKTGAAAWSTGLSLWFDAATNECRGSIVKLEPGVAYEAQLGVSGSFSRQIGFTTWANTKPVARTVAVGAGSATLNITSGGTAGGYVVYDGGGAVLDARNAAQFNIAVNASYVIVRNFVLRGAQQDAIRVSPNVTDVIIEDNDIAGWGRTRDGRWGTEMDSGIRAICSSETLTRLTVQRNRIHDPRYPANSWSDGHPAGPQAITISYCGGNNVYRWNEIYSAQNHFNDGIGGEDNSSTTGFPNKDSDIYGNRIEMTWDDGIEAEGGNQNVRIWGNYLNNTGTGIATTITSVGPVYIFRNVYNRSRFYENVAPDADDRQPLFKSGSGTGFGNGRRYLFHNTMLQATQAGLAYPLGGGAGVGGTGSTQLVRNTVSMNNIYHVWKTGSTNYQIGSDNTFQNDMYNGSSFGTAIVGGINRAPTYAAGNGWQNESGGQYALAAGTPGYDGGVRIANFNDGFVGAAPDVGASEAGAPAMTFGVAAATAPTSAGGGGPAGNGGTTSPSGGTTGTLTNLSTRGRVETGNDVMVGGFVIGGSAAKTVVVRAIGPSLTAYGVPGALADPFLQVIRMSDQATMATNDNWGSAANVAQIVASGFAPTHPLESAVILTLAPGAYTAIVSGAGGATGVGLVEVYQVDRPDVPLINLSTRGRVQGGNDVMIGGFVIQGASPRTVVVRGIGPSLTGYGIAGALANPTLQLVRVSDQATLAVNDDWQSGPNATQLWQLGLAPSHAMESAIMITLAPGAYAAILSGVNGGVGTGLVEVYLQ